MGTPRVALLIDTSLTWGSELLRGINRYATEFGPWLFYLEPRGRFERLQLPADWQGDGVIARITNGETVAQLERHGVPVVNVSTADPSQGLFAQCTSDEWQAGCRTARHFLERGFRNFAYCAAPEKRDGYVDGVWDGFVEALAAQGFASERLAPATPKATAVESPVLLNWLRQLPRPTGLLAWNAVQGRRIAEACTQAGLRVPDEIAIVCGEHDDLFCDLSNPPLSAVRHDGAQVGYRAAALLQRLMNGEPKPSQPMRVDVLDVETRRSSDVLAVDDELVRDALSFIRDRACQGLNVMNLARSLAISRRALELRFRATLNSSPADEIRRVKIAHAKELLRMTDMSIARVAAATGFGTRTALWRQFSEQIGMQPSEFRQEHRTLR